MVVGREALFEKDCFEGFQSVGKVDFEARCLAYMKSMRRGQVGDIALGKVSAEETPEFKQPIGYCLIVNSSDRRVFAYRRETSKERYAEDRLAGKWSWGVGGHVDEEDNAVYNPIEGSIRREIGEEVTMDGRILHIRKLGYINDDQDSVGKVHFGIVYLAETDSKIVRPTKGHENQTGEMVDFKKLERMINSYSQEYANCIVENWSKLAMIPLEKRFE